jgi:hypothetical protein
VNLLSPNDWDGFSRDVEYLSVDPRAVAWHLMPDWFVTQEPRIGQRLIFLERDLGVATTQETVARLTREWESQRGYKPRVYPTLTLSEMTLHFHAITATLVQNGRLSPQVAARQDGLTRSMASYAAKIADGNLSEAGLADGLFRFHTALNRFLVLVSNSPHLQHYLRTLVRLNPFALQGSTGKNLRAFVVEDARYLEKDGHSIWRIDWNRWPLERKVYFSFEFLPMRDLADFPPLILGRDSMGQPLIVWNPATELKPAQLGVLSIRPFAMQQYARHVADTWEQEFGRRPRVLASSFASLNQNVMQRLIDPEADLASAPFTPLRHHEWILPIDRGITRDNRASSGGASSDQTTKDPARE